MQNLSFIREVTGKSKIKESKQMNKLCALKKNKIDTYDYAIFHILKYHKTNTLKKNKIYLINISH